jgi:predicted acylesterase/phospholipase RssA
MVSTLDSVERELPHRSNRVQSISSVSKNGKKKYRINFTRPKITKLGFVGGGSKGLVYPGAIQGLESAGILADVDTVAGSSAGALTATLLAVGMTPDEINETVSSINLTDFMTRNVKGEKNESRGVFSGRPMQDKINEIIAVPITKKKKAAEEYLSQLIVELEESRQTINQDKTLTDEEKQEKINLLTKKIGSHIAHLEKINNIDPEHVKFKELEYLREIPDTGVKKLIITGSNIDDQILEFFEADAHPDMEVALAARISASFPGVFKAVEYNGKRYVDGGAINNLPLSALENFYENEDKPLFELNKEENARSRMLGFLLGENKAEFLNDESLIYGEKKFIANVKTYLKNKFSGVINSAHQAALKDSLRQKYNDRIITLPIGDVSTLTRKVTDESRAELIKSAEEKVSTYFNDLDNYTEMEFDDPVEMFLTMNFDDLNNDGLISAILEGSDEEDSEFLIKVLDSVRELRANENELLNDVYSTLSSLNVKLEEYFAFIETYEIMSSDDFTDLQALQDAIDAEMISLNSKIDNLISKVDLLEKNGLITNRELDKYKQITCNRIHFNSSIDSKTKQVFDNLSKYSLQKVSSYNELMEHGESLLSSQASDFDESIYQEPKISELTHLDKITDINQNKQLELAKQGIIKELKLKKGYSFQTKENIKVLNEAITQIQQSKSSFEVVKSLKVLDNYQPRSILGLRTLIAKILRIKKPTETIKFAQKSEQELIEKGKVKITLSVMRIPPDERQNNIFTIYKALQDINDKPELITNIITLMEKINPADEREIADVLTKIKGEINAANDSDFSESAGVFIDAFKSKNNFRSIRDELNKNPIAKDHLDSIDRLTASLTQT